MEYAISLMGFVLVSTITPGPNNLLLAASGIRFGFRRTLPHVVGIQCGVYTLVALCGIATPLGNVLAGTTTTDYDTEEIAKQHSIQLALAHADYDGLRLNLIDTPGYPDFFGEAHCAVQ